MRIKDKKFGAELMFAGRADYLCAFAASAQWDNGI
jgi:hypothetical protein